MDYTIVTTVLQDIFDFFYSVNSIFDAVTGKDGFAANAADTVTFYRDHIRG